MSERGLVEKVADEIDPWIDSHGDDERIRGYAIGAARAIIKEVADAAESELRNQQETYGVEEDIELGHWQVIDWLRSQAREPDDE